MDRDHARHEGSWVISRIVCDATATDYRTKTAGAQLQQICGIQKCFKTLTVMFRTSEDPNLDTKRMKKKTRILFLHVSFTEILYMHSLSDGLQEQLQTISLGSPPAPSPKKLSV